MQKGCLIRALFLRWELWNGAYYYISNYLFCIEVILAELLWSTVALVTVLTVYLWFLKKKKKKGRADSLPGENRRVKKKKAFHFKQFLKDVYRCVFSHIKIMQSCPSL